MTALQPDTPDEALAALLAGNDRFARGERRGPGTDVPPAELAAGQAPFAAIIRCADSRVAPEICFDQPLGRLFVCGVAGNLPTDEITASLEYAVAVLGVRLIVVMGHSQCGAVSAAVEHWHDTSALPGNLPGLADQIISACTGSFDPNHDDALARAIACNACAAAATIARQSSIISDAINAGTVQIVAGVQDLASGRFGVLP